MAVMRPSCPPPRIPIVAPGRIALTAATPQPALPLYGIPATRAAARASLDLLLQAAEQQIAQHSPHLACRSRAYPPAHPLASEQSKAKSRCHSTSSPEQAHQ